MDRFSQKTRNSYIKIYYSHNNEEINANHGNLSVSYATVKINQSFDSIHERKKKTLIPNGIHRHDNEFTSQSPHEKVPRYSQ